MSTVVSNDRVEGTQSGFPVAAGSAAIGAALSALLSGVETDRQVAIGLSNFLTSKLKHPKFTCSSGGVNEMPLEIEPDMADAFVGEKTNGSLYGTEGVATYDIDGTSHKVAIYWSIPLSYAEYKNKFNLAIVDTHASAALIRQLAGTSIAADHGFYSVDQEGFKIEAVMGTKGCATLNVTLKTG